MTLTKAQRATLARLLADFAPGESVTAEREEPHDRHVFVAVYTRDGRLVLDTIVEADGQLPDDQCCQECSAFVPETPGSGPLSRHHQPSCSLHDEHADPGPATGSPTPPHRGTQCVREVGDRPAVRAGPTIKEGLMAMSTVLAAQDRRR